MYHMLKMYKRCTLKIPHEFYFHVIHVVQHLLQFFHDVSMHFSCGNNTNTSINVICVRKTQTPLTLYGVLHIKLVKQYGIYNGG
jgi:hypothetical protein